MKSPGHTHLITATDIYQFFQCPHWPYYERFATPQEQALRRVLSSGEIERMENGLAHEQTVIESVFGGTEEILQVKTPDTVKAFEQTLAWMKQGVPLIYQGTLSHGNWVGRPDILERREGESIFGHWYYVPIDVKSSHAVEKYQKLQLTFYALLLERIQGRFPAEPAIINIDRERISFMAGEMVDEFARVMADLERIAAGEKPDPVLRKSCFDTGPWGEVCKQYAEAQNDIALLYNVDVPKLKLLRGLGLRTVSDIANMDPYRYDGVAKGLRLHGLETMKRQAQALESHLVMIREPVSLPNPPLEIHFDIESDPPNDVDYLYGFLIREDGVDRYLPFVADELSKEGEMWREFLAWLETLPSTYVVYHYSVYEMTRLAVLEKRYGGSDALDQFRENMVDLKELVSDSCTFPLYFYGLKYIAKFLGFSWRGDVTGGGQSVDVFEEFLRTKNRALLDSIILYNEDDVRATAYLKDWLANFAGSERVFTEPYPWADTL